MTTLTQTTANFNTTNTAGLQASGAELNGWLTTVGLIQTADTGQVNWATVTLPGQGAIIGYEIWKFSDSSYYMKFEYRINASSGTGRCPQFFVTVGTGSDGVGNITGTLYARQTMTGTDIGALTAGNKTTYICHTADFFGMSYKIGGSTGDGSGAIFSVFVEKVVDSSGAVSSGIIVSHRNPVSGINIHYKACATSAGVIYGENTSFCVVAGGLTNSDDGAGNKQIFAHQVASPQVVFSNYMGTIVASEAGIGTTITATIVGSTSHTYISLGTSVGYGNSASASATWAIVMLWE